MGEFLRKSGLEPSPETAKEIIISGERVSYYEVDSEESSALFRRRIANCCRTGKIMSGSLLPNGKVVFMIEPQVDHGALRKKLGFRQKGCVDFVYYPEETTPEDQGLVAIFGYARDNRCGTTSLIRFIAGSFPPELGETKLCASCLRSKLSQKGAAKVYEGPIRDWR